MLDTETDVQRDKENIEMAGRPIKQGIDYFPLDTHFFSDVKIRKIARACGPNAASVLICLLCNIYRGDGYYIVWDEDLPFCIADEVGVSEGCVKEILLKAVQVGFFDVEKHSAYGILTSSGIQKRFFDITKRREETEVIPEYLINADINSINACKNSINVCNNGQSKGVKVKRRKSKAKNNEEEKETSTCVEEKKISQAGKLDAARAATLKRKEEFYNSLIPYVDRYGKDMVRDFFDYWSEMNKSRTKMRYEKQETWEVALRLATWSKREKEKFNGKRTDTSQERSESRRNLASLAAEILAADAAEDD